MSEALGADAVGDRFIELDRLEKVFDVRKKTGFLRRERREVRAVDSISFTVARGEMVGYIGPNGAGKSTTIKMLTGILTPSGGRLRVAASTRRVSGRGSPGVSGWCSGSVRPCGGTSPSSTPTG